MVHVSVNLKPEIVHIGILNQKMTLFCRAFWFNKFDKKYTKKSSGGVPEGENARAQLIINSSEFSFFTKQVCFDR